MKEETIGSYFNSRPFLCDEPGCSKSFQRSDHLSRHKQNHTRKKLYSCIWPGCDKQFVRKDVRKKHIQRHQSRNEKSKLRSKGPIRFLNVEPLGTEAERPNSASASDSMRSQTKGSPDMKTESMELSLENIEESYSPITNVEYTSGVSQNGPYIVFGENKSQTSQTLEARYSILSTESMNSAVSRSQNLSNEYEENAHVQLDHLESDKVPEKTLPPSDLMNWLFNDASFLIQNSNPFFSSMDYSPTSAFNEMLSISPNFPLPNYQTNVFEETRVKMIELIPSLQRNFDFGLTQLECCLEYYWLVYHVQFPVLHRPSFSTLDANPLLLLSMIAVGASIVSRQINCPVSFENAPRLAEEIADPLRWLIFSAADSAPSATPWVIQSLLILESYEITSSSRRLHQRAYLHHGLKIQLLRRSPLLGGDPLDSNKNEDRLSEEKDSWKKWIEIESLKRCTLMAFLIDTIHATIFGHETIVSAHQIKLSLPCDEILWEMSNIDKNNLPPQTETPKFLTALSKLLHREKFETGPFSRKILLAGLLTIVFQMEQIVVHSKVLEWESVKHSWKETIFSAIEFWLDSVCHGDCCDARVAFYLPFGNVSSVSSFRVDDTRCKFSIYHVAQVFLRVNQYDCIIYAGAQSRMNVKTGASDYEVVSNRIREWATSFGGRISVVHAYLLISEMILTSTGSDDTPTPYDPRTDPVLYRPNIIASLLFVIWAYNFCLEGPESNAYSSLERNPSGLDNNSLATTIDLSSKVDNYCVPERINGYDYIRRIQKEFKNSLKGNKRGSIKLVEAYARVLDRIPEKNCTVGLLRLFKDGYKGCDSQICQEYSKLLENCIERGLGKETVACEDMCDYTTV